MGKARGLARSYSSSARASMRGTKQGGTVATDTVKGAHNAQGTQADTQPDGRDILKKFDKESDYRNYTGLMAKIVAAIAITFSCFQLYTAVFGVLDAMIQRSIHLAFGLSLAYLLYPASKSWSRE